MNKTALEFWCSTTAEIYRIPVRLYYDKKLVEAYSTLGDDMGTFSIEDENLLHSKSEYTVQLHVTGNIFMYGKIIDKYSLFSVIIGPILPMSVSHESIKDIILKNSLPLDSAAKLKSIYDDIPIMEIYTFIRFLSLVNTTINHTVLPPELLISEDYEITSDITSDLIKTEENLHTAADRHISHEYEQRFLYCIRNGLIDEIDEASTARYKGRPGKMSIDPTRQIKNMLLAMNTLCIRAAIEGGLDPETAYTVGEIYAQRIDLCNDQMQLNGISRQIRKDYCKRVHDLKYPQTSDLTIQKALKYIATHVTEKLSTTDIANELGISRGYLSTRFKDVTGVSVTDYINVQKIREAKQLLKFSDKSLVAISNYLSFSSQSYFQNVFKSITGKTPTEYRKEKDV